MRLRNTSGLDNALVREVIRFVRPAGISNFDVMVKASKFHCAGRSYSQGSGYHMTADPFVTIRIGPADKFPFKQEAYGPGYLSWGWVYSRTEALVGLMAHELRHQWQAHHGRGRVWGARGKFSERDADAYAIRKLREWRRVNGYTLG